MGAVFIASAISLPTGKTPDWEAGVRKVEALRTTPVSKWPEEFREDVLGDTIEEEDASTSPDHHVFSDLLELIDTLKDGSDQEIMELTYPERRIWISGGLSWGDAPTDGYLSIDRLITSGVAAAIGLE